MASHKSHAGNIPITSEMPKSNESSDVVKPDSVIKPDASKVETPKTKNVSQKLAIRKERIGR